MTKRILILILIFYLFIVEACTSIEETHKIQIYDYSIGDTLSADFEITLVQDFPFSRAVLLKDSRFEVHLINNYISSMWFYDLTSNEHSEFEEYVTNQLGFTPKYYKDSTPFNIKIKGALYYWKDTVTGITVMLGRDTSKDTNYSYLSVYNSAYSDSLI
jgi:hypothetical protein